MEARTNQRFFGSRLAPWLSVMVFLGMLALIGCGASVSSKEEDTKQVVARFIEEFKNKANQDIVQTSTLRITSINTGEETIEIIIGRMMGEITWSKPQPIQRITIIGKRISCTPVKESEYAQATAV